ncbi:MAG: undecaprenyl-phosphate galactose phosphotransferase WbaP [Thermaceae bacterium]
MKQASPPLYRSLASTFYILVLADLVTLTTSFLLPLWLRHLLRPTPPLEGTHLSLWPLGPLFLLAYALVGLYGVGVSPPEELRRLSYATTVVFAALGTATFLSETATNLSRGVFVLAWGLALVLVPLGRALAREVFARRPWWGAPVVVLGAGKTGEAVVRVLRKTPGLGLKPVALLDDDQAKWEREVEGVPVLGGLERARELAQKGVRHALVAMPGVRREDLLKLLEEHGANFPHLILIPDLFGLPSLWVTSRDLGGVLGLEVQNKLLIPWLRWVKRAMDIGLIVLFSPFLLPIFGLLAFWVWLDSRGPVLYRQLRVGFGGKPFYALKFRSMVADADQVLERYLQQHPELRAEWEAKQKLRFDPRITKAGKVLRKTSLDELPQLWNVLKGEMSLVGPRPALPTQVDRYGQYFNLYSRVKPGLTGLWQVSGRNETTYAERVAMDVYYVLNWSPWLDLYILARTVWVVLLGKGAY